MHSDTQVVSGEPGRNEEIKGTMAAGSGPPANCPPTGGHRQTQRLLGACALMRALNYLRAAAGAGGLWLFVSDPRRALRSDLPGRCRAPAAQTGAGE